MTTLFIINGHVYGICQVYVGGHELYIRVHEHGNDNRFSVFHYQNGRVYGVSRYGYVCARVLLFRVYVNVHGLP